jgi:uncharacterized damage-inducible protein DinB
VASSHPGSLAARFRHWYAYERDCNAKVMTMLLSVPERHRGSAAFVRAVGKMAHLVAARHFWLRRLGACDDRPESWFPSTPLERLPGLLEEVERRWTVYLERLTDAHILAPCELTSEDGSRWRWPLIDLLTQLFGHAWYHRGQVALLVKDAGGQPINTDYIFWSGPERIPASD